MRYCLLLLLISCQTRDADYSYLKGYKKRAKNYFWERSDRSHFTSSDLKSLPSSPEKRVLYYFQRGKLSISKKDNVGAVSFFQKAYNMMGGGLVPLVGRVSIACEFALSLMKVKRYKRASEVIFRAIELEKQGRFFSRLPFLYYHQGLIYDYLKEGQKAEASWRASLFYSDQFNDTRYYFLAQKKLNGE